MSISKLQTKARLVEIYNSSKITKQVELISTEFNLNSGTAGFITTLPLIAFAIVSPFVSTISRKLGFGKTMMMGLILILLGEIVRSYTSVLGLFIGAALIGVGIAIGNVLIPSIIKLKFGNNIGKNYYFKGI